MSFLMLAHELINLYTANAVKLPILQYLTDFEGVLNTSCLRTADIEALLVKNHQPLPAERASSVQADVAFTRA